MKEKEKNMKTTFESIRKELVHLSKVYRDRKAALEKMSKSVLDEEDEILDNEKKLPKKNKPKT